MTHSPDPKPIRGRVFHQKFCGCVNRWEWMVIDSRLQVDQRVILDGMQRTLPEAHDRCAEAVAAAREADAGCAP